MVRSLLARSDAGAAFEREADGSKRLGPSVSLELPLFQQGQGRVVRAVAELEQAQAVQRELEIAIDADVQQQLQRVALASDAATGYREGLIPQREAIVARLQEQANFMIVDTFKVLLAKQQEYAAYDGYVDAVQDYWRARVALLRAVGTQLVATLPVAATVARLAAAGGAEVWRTRNRAEGLPRPLYLRGVSVTLPDGARRTVD